MNVGVVGCGVMGAATARVLAKRGHDVTVYEQFEPGHKRGSSHGATRIYRFSYPLEMFVGMMGEALELWRELETEVGSSLLTQTGGLDCGKLLDEHAVALDAHDIAYEILEPDAVRRRWPSLKLPGEALFQADGGFVRADLAWGAFVAGATEAGAKMERRRIEDLSDLAHDRIVVTAGGWAQHLLARNDIDLPTRPTRETVAFFRTEETHPTLVDWGDPSVYALPDPTCGLKVGEHIAGPTTDPDQEGVVDEVSVERLRRWVEERYLDVDLEPAFAQTCIYTNTDDEHFILERRGDVIVGSACSGHGFKFAPLIGKRLADLAEG